jgi:hypothetical protein
LLGSLLGDVVGLLTGVAFMGAFVGSAVGAAKGFADGEFVTGIIFVGLDVGADVAGLLVVGNSVGGAVWTFDGCNVGVDFGGAVGFVTGAELAFGLFVGNSIGAAKGFADGEFVTGITLVGLDVGTDVAGLLVAGNSVGGSVWRFDGCNVGVDFGGAFGLEFGVSTLNGLPEGLEVNSVLGKALVVTVVGNAELFNVGSELGNVVGVGTFIGVFSLLGESVCGEKLGDLTGIPVGELAG